MTSLIKAVCTLFPVYSGVIWEMYVYKTSARDCHLFHCEGEEFVVFVKHSAFYLEILRYSIFK